MFLFGAPRIEHNGQAVPLRHTKALALLAYLAVTGQPQDRDALLALLWPEFDAANARNNLRRELSRLKSTLGEELLVADRRQVRWNEQVDSWLDLAAFQAQLIVRQQHGHARDEVCAECAAALTTAAQLYTDDFLAGFGLPDCPAFDEWQFFEREELRQQLAEVLQDLISWYRGAEDYAAAIVYARRWLALDGLHEVAQRELMRLYTWSGQQSAALRQYAESARLLDKELGIEPETETTELYKAIKARRLASPATTAEPARVVTAAVTIRAGEPPSPAPQPPPPLYNLPPTSVFIGRQRELADLLRRLTDPDCRLLSLVGPGGIGKTRLALRAAQILAQEWSGADGLADGVLFVPLAAVETSSGLVSALAAAARFEFYRNVPPDQQVLDYFRARRMLIVLDNFEQLLDTVAFVAELLAAAPGLRLLVTSREALNLQEEWFHPVDGLSFPDADDNSVDVGQLARFDAIRLFEQHARRSRSDFSLSRERTAVVSICRMVEGMPLGLELAASWLKVLPVEHVAAALERDLDILATRDRNIPQRHRSMRTVLEGTWRQLSAEEQQTLAGLAVFRGSFSAEAAAAVVRAPLAALAALGEKSLLRSGANGRFQMHELLRQFAAEQLAADVQLSRGVEARYRAYYLDFLAERETRLQGGERRAAGGEIAGEAANVRMAWQGAVEAGDLARLDHALLSLFSYYVTRNDYQEGDELLRLAAALSTSEALPHDELTHRRVLTRIRIRHGALRYLLGDHVAAMRELQRGLEEARELGIQAEVACAHLFLGAVARWNGDTPTARRYLNDALAFARAVGDSILGAQALQLLAELGGGWGEYAEGERLAQECLELCRAAERDDLRAHTLSLLAWYASCQGEYKAAEAYYRENLALAERSGDEIGVSSASAGVGWVAWCIGGTRLQEAREWIERSVAIERRRGRRLWLANYLGDLALIAIDSGEYEQAWAYAQEGLALARELASAIYTAYHLSILGRIAAARQELAASVGYLHEALRMAWEARLWTQLTFGLYHAAETLICGGRPERAVEVLAAIAYHPATWHAIQIRAQRRLAGLRDTLSAEVMDAAIACGQQLDWQSSVAALLDELARPPLAESQEQRTTL